MKNITFTTLFVFFTTLGVNAQIIDTVSIGGNYEDQVWYKLDNGQQTIVDGSSWDFGFQIKGQNASIIANTSYGSTLYLYPNGDTSAWNNLDTLGISQWTSWFDSPTSWDEGAFNQGINPADPFDLGWGKYNMQTHHIVGDSLYVWKTADGTVYKIWIQNLISSTYNFIVSDYTGTTVDTISLNKSDFKDKEFGYYSIAQKTTLDREPKSEDWDLTIGKYTEDLGIPYAVTGIRTKKGLEAVKVYPVDDVDNYDSFKNQTYSSEINIIGYDWKTYDFNSASYLIEDSTVYFVKTDSTTYWKLVMKGFEGSVNGNFIFEKSNLTTGLFKGSIDQGTFTVYPNPVADGKVSVITDVPSTVRKAELSILSINGQLVQSEQLQINKSFEVHSLNLKNLKQGVYFIRLSHEGGAITQKLIIK